MSDLNTKWRTNMNIVSDIIEIFQPKDLVKVDMLYGMVIDEISTGIELHAKLISILDILNRVEDTVIYKIKPTKTDRLNRVQLMLHDGTYQSSDRNELIKLVDELTKIEPIITSSAEGATNLAFEMLRTIKIPGQRGQK